MKRILIAFAFIMMQGTCVALPWQEFIGEFKGESTIASDQVGDHTIGQHSPIKIKFVSQEDNSLALYINDERIDQLPEYQITFPSEHVVTIAWAGEVIVLPARILFNLNLHDNKLIGEKRVILFSKQRSGRIKERTTQYQLELQR